MWTTEVTRPTSCSKEQLWKLWTNVRQWNTWDRDIATAEVFGEFKTGTKGRIKPVDGPKISFTITECTPFTSFTNTSILPLCMIHFHHSIHETAQGNIVTHRVTITGLMAFFFTKILGPKLRAGLPIAIDRLIEQGEKHR